MTKKDVGTMEESSPKNLLGKVTSFVRVKPSSISTFKHKTALSTAAANTKNTNGSTSSSSVRLVDGRTGKERCFKPDWVIGSNEDQQDVFNTVGRPLVDCMLDTQGCDGAVLCYGGIGMGKLHTLYETSTSYQQEHDPRMTNTRQSTHKNTSTSGQASSIYETPIFRTPGIQSHQEGLLIRVVHNIFRRIAWKKFQSPMTQSTPVDKDYSTTTLIVGDGQSRNDTESGQDHELRLHSPDMSRSLPPSIATMELQVSSSAVTHSGAVIDLLEGDHNGQGTTDQMGFSLGDARGLVEMNDDGISHTKEEEEGEIESMKTPTLKRTKAVAAAKEMQKKMEQMKWISCTNTVDFESKLKPALDLCHKQEQANISNSDGKEDQGGIASARRNMWSSKKDQAQFVVTQLRLVDNSGVGISQGSFFSKIAFVLVLPGETLAMEGPVLTGTHLSASMLRLRAVLDALTGIGSKNQALLRANASLANMLSAPLGSPRLLHTGPMDVPVHHQSSKAGRPPFVCLMGCVAPDQDQINQVSGFLSFAERAKQATLLHANTTTNHAKHPPPAAIGREPQDALIASPAKEPEESEEKMHPPEPQSKRDAQAPGTASMTTPMAPTPVQHSTLLQGILTKAAKDAAAAADGDGSESGIKTTTTKAMVPMLTPPSVRAVSKLGWPTASPGTFETGLQDFAHIRNELESIWGVMREAERYHEEALAAAEVELHEAEAATRRAGARANEMKKIIASLREEIRNQKSAHAHSKASGGDNEEGVAASMSHEINQLKEQVKDEQLLRREAEAALAALDDECARLTEKLQVAKESKPKCRNARIQCALGAAGGSSGQAMPMPMISVSESLHKDSSEARRRNRGWRRP